MRKILIMLTLLIAAMTSFGTVVVVYANTPHVLAVAPKPTQPPVPNWVDKQVPVAPQIKNNVISQGNETMPEVALTFDDGPSPSYTPQILNVLQQYNVHATFFCAGENVQYYPDLVQQEQSAGNVVANHSWSHPDLTTLSTNGVHTQLNNTSVEIQQVTGTRPTFFRPPYGAVDNKVLAQSTQLGLKPVLWSVDTLDWQRPGSSAIVTAVLNQVGNGGVILLHDGGGDRSQTVAALPTIINDLQQRGYQLVTIQQMYNHMPQNG